MIKTIVAGFFAAVSMLAAPVPTFASVAVALACSGPDSWSRPGGYCDQMGGTKSLAEPGTSVDPGSPSTCQNVGEILPLGGRVHVATPDPCCNADYKFDRKTNRVIVAANCGGGGNNCGASLLNDPSILSERDRILLVAC